MPIVRGCFTIPSIFTVQGRVFSAWASRHKFLPSLNS